MATVSISSWVALIQFCDMYCHDPITNSRKEQVWWLCRTRETKSLNRKHVILRAMSIVCGPCTVQSGLCQLQSTLLASLCLWHPHMYNCTAYCTYVLVKQILFETEEQGRICWVTTDTSELSSLNPLTKLQALKQRMPPNTGYACYHLRHC
jgi:hypothetical protein